MNKFKISILGIMIIFFVHELQTADDEGARGGAGGAACEAVPAVRRGSIEKRFFGSMPVREGRVLMVDFDHRSSVAAKFECTPLVTRMGFEEGSIEAINGKNLIVFVRDRETQFVMRRVGVDGTVLVDFDIASAPIPLDLAAGIKGISMGPVKYSLQVLGSDIRQAVPYDKLQQSEQAVHFGINLEHLVPEALTIKHTLILGIPLGFGPGVKFLRKIDGATGIPVDLNAKKAIGSAADWVAPEPELAPVTAREKVVAFLRLSSAGGSGDSSARSARRSSREDVARLSIAKVVLLDGREINPRLVRTASAAGIVDGIELVVKSVIGDGTVIVGRKPGELK